jgi:hypothetical protein
MRRIKVKISDLMQFANQEEEYYDPKLLLTDKELQKIKDRNKDNEDVQKLLNDLGVYKKIIMIYENT